MALRQNLTEPYVVKPLSDHTHTVIFLHRFPESTDDKTLRTKVLSTKLTKDGKTLRLQFPTVRWVFPHAKLHDDGNDKHWNDLTPEDCAAAGLELGPKAPYVAQLILQEAQRAGGLDKIVLGGQGETALAAHAALNRLRQTMSGYAPDSAMHAFVTAQMEAHLPGLEPWKLAGYVGMHPDDKQTPRDQRDYWLVSKFTGGKCDGDEQPVPDTVSTGNSNINDRIVRNTPHEFIRGGYKNTSPIWDGERIDDFAEFLARIGIARGEPGKAAYAASLNLRPKPALGPIQAPSAKPKDSNKGELSAQQKYAQEVKEQKKRDEEYRKRILLQIEDQKAERKLKQERERVGRFFAEQAALERKARGENEPPVPAVSLYPSSQSPSKDKGAASYAAVPPVAASSSRLHVDPWRDEYDDDIDDDIDDGADDFEDSDSDSDSDIPLTVRPSS
ncbi:Acyl-protein thioesterase [Apiospora marii]|uniref:Acyl-protein thioesterase n=1 Tax=Apiospora marii TaxID=335849 RepID=UPI003131CE4C